MQRRDVRVRERPRRRRPRARVARRARLPPRGCARSRAGPVPGEVVLREARDPHCPLRLGRLARRARARGGPHRPPGGPEDAPLRLRRQGAGGHSLPSRARRRVGRGERRPEHPRALRPVRSRAVDPRRPRQGRLGGDVRPGRESPRRRDPPCLLCSRPQRPAAGPSRRLRRTSRRSRASCRTSA